MSAGGRGALVHEFSCEPGCRFEAARIQLRLSFGPAYGGRGERIEVSADDGGTWIGVPAKYSAPLRRAEADLTSCVAGKNSFRLRFSARNDTDEDVILLNLIRVFVDVARGEAQGAARGPLGP